MSRSSQLWLYVCVVAAVAVAAYACLVWQSPEWTSDDLRMGALLLLVAPIAEMLVVHVQIRKSAHSFSLLELPLAAGLLLAHPLVLVTAYVVGGGLVLFVHRRQAPMKLVFNTASFAVTACAAVLVYTLFAHSGDPGSPGAVGAALAGSVSASLVGTVLVAGVISIAERRLAWRDLRSSMAFGLGTSLGGASMGITIALIWQVAPFAVPLAGVPLVAVFLANRAYESERQRRESLEVVYETSRELREATESDEGLFAAMRRCLDSLPCDYVSLFVPLGRAGIVRLTVDPSENQRTVVSGASAEVFTNLSTLDSHACRITPTTDGVDNTRWSKIAHALDDAQLAEVLVAPLASGTEHLGTLVVASHGGAFRSFAEADANLLQTIGNGIASHTRLMRLAFEDGLTGLPNRRRLLQQVDGACATGNVRGHAFVIIDLDDFKGINDTFGHAMGDTVLIEVGTRLRNALPLAVVARLGGDEFAVWTELPNGDWESVAGLVLGALDAPLYTPGGPFTVRISAGFALADSGDSSSTLLRNADTALYEAKRLGKGRARLFTAEMHAAVARKFLMIDDLRRALGADELTTAFQPTVQLNDRKIIGAEALCRWSSKQLGEVHPLEFVQLAEEQGMSAALAQHIVATVNHFADGLPPGPFVISLNLSPGDLSNREILRALRSAAQRQSPNVLAVEITERLLAEGPEVNSCLAELRDMGIRIYIDDFGTGYSSLSYLKDLPIDALKIPREFVQAISTDVRSLSVVRAIIGMGRSLGLELIAEGVETEAQLEVLSQLGVKYGQGYLFSPAVPEEQFLALVAPMRTAVAA